MYSASSLISMLPQDKRSQPAEFALRFRLSFQPFINYLKRQSAAQSDSAGGKQLREFVVNQLSQFQSAFLNAGKPYENARLSALFDLVTFSILPPNPKSPAIPFAIGLTQPLQLLYYSPDFEQIVEKFPNLPADIKTQLGRDEKLRFYYQLILSKCYGLKDVTTSPLYFSFQQELNGLTSFYQITIDETFLHPEFRTDLPSLQSEWIEFATGALPDINELKFQLPLEQFIIDGFAFFYLQDVTEAETIKQLQNVFTHLQSESEPLIYKLFTKVLRNLCGLPDLLFGLMPLVEVNGRFTHFPEYTSRSILLSLSDWQIGTLETANLEHFLGYIERDLRPRVNTWLTNESQAPHLQILYSKGIRSFVFYPIMDGNVWIGSLEIASMESGTLTDEVVKKLELVVPLVRELLLYQRTKFNARLEQVIKQQFTPIQSAVEWRFNEAAFDCLLTGRPTQVRFAGVYPLYGAVDIRNSSIERNRAIRQDFSEQLTAIETILSAVTNLEELTELYSLLTKSQYWQTQLSTRMGPDEEAEVTYFLAHDVTSYFRELQADYINLEQSIQAYFEASDSQTGLFNQTLQTFEQSLGTINRVLRNYIEQQEYDLRNTQPHYVDKYLTDGLEYTFYVGDSITSQTQVVPDSLHRFRLWQLSAMVDMARLTYGLRSTLPIPLQTTQLILAHAQPVDISFRSDERRFDVEGSYSIRYEVIKKRIDKAHIDGTNERLTQPDTIALVYANNRELSDWLPVVEAIQALGKLGPQIDYVPVEPLQGVLGLKAIRLHINYEL